MNNLQNRKSKHKFFDRKTYIVFLVKKLLQISISNYLTNTITKITKMSTKRLYILKQIYSFQLQACLGMCELSVDTRR